MKARPRPAPTTARATRTMDDVQALADAIADAVANGNQVLAGCQVTVWQARRALLRWMWHLATRRSA